MRVMTDIEVLRQIPLFAESDAVHLQLLSFSSERVDFNPGSILFQKGTVGAAAYFVLDGTAEIYEDAEAAGNVVATAESGALLGGLSMIAEVAYGVTVKTTSSFTAKRIDRDLFIRLAAEFPDFGLGIIRNIAVRLGRSVEALREIKPLFQS
jgi:CRP-like cAMP-binding protein